MTDRNKELRCKSAQAYANATITTCGYYKASTPGSLAHQWWHTAAHFLRALSGETNIDHLSLRHDVFLLDLVGVDALWGKLPLCWNSLPYDLLPVGERTSM